MNKKNYIKEMLKKTEFKNSWHPDFISDAAKLSNIYIYGQHVEMQTINKNGDLVSRDITREFLTKDWLPNEPA